MTQNQKVLIGATVPILRQSGEVLTDYFYERMFRHHPELKSMFNMGNQANGRQKSALANAVLAYAENIDNPAVLIDVLKGIGSKHTSLNIQPEQYKIVGTHLIASIREVIGEPATDEILEAWTTAFYQLADIMIKIEKELYADNLIKEGGWNGWRDFVIKKIDQESAEIKSFYLYPKDGKAIADFHPGQFISIQIFIRELNLLQPRQYSLSNSYNAEYYRISVKKESGMHSNPAGTVSNALHAKSEGDIVSISAPSGLFHLEKDSKSPLVLISGGVGLTPMVSMLEANMKSLQHKKTVWIHGCRNESVHAFKNHIEHLKQNTQWLETYTFYDSAKNLQNLPADTFIGRVNLEKCLHAVQLQDARFYICGPEIFIKVQYESLINLNVNAENIFYEEFGPQLINLN
ncbi:NO-inducible flavohemoprotein [Flavobacterium sp. ARAG 55.4]|uniref:nitric oxide dioxygenase n=1 Tax=Flavobacterium plantiphilum TaxID=3163297 RepID=A0ABW8XX24_9FLAO